MNWITGKKCSAAEAAEMIQNGYVLGISEFTLAGYPKAVPLAIASRAERLHDAGQEFKVTLFAGASTGDSCDGALARAKALSLRMPYQSNPSLRKAINDGSIHYIDAHLGKMDYLVRTGAVPAPTVAIFKNCAHPYFREPLIEFLEYGLKHAKGKHLPLALDHAFEMHNRFLETGSMKL